MKLADFLSDTRTRFETHLLSTFQPSPSQHLASAIHYSLLNGGKRLRPALVRAAALACEHDNDDWLVPATAIEVIHVYSLIHDDLPAMDDDDLRRGKPTNHKAFDEATAILAGDALQAEAFQLLANAVNFNDAQVRRMLISISAGAGHQGMVGGQMLDILAEKQNGTLEQLETIHRLKTGALIKAALTLGALCQKNVSQETLEQLENYGDAIGLAFQITDDILDVTSSTEVLGKPQGSDLDGNKTTYVSLLGLTGAEHHAQQQFSLAIESLTNMGLNESSLLWQLAEYILNREY
ncbi:polyprenyl synthetase family protein [Reinekea sp.]|jgi:geranylgeranyl pyrophosphate synthase|uniref:polyprenyl synthetase family protein n=1 Tax=Reinekea sp. TaxID=1970455 RepID=UPI00398A44B5